MSTGHLNVGFTEEDASVEGFLNLCVKWWYLQLATFFGLQPWQRAFGYGENNQGTDWSLCLLFLCFTPVPKYPDLLQNSAKLFCLDPYKFVAAPKNCSTGNWFVQQKPLSQQLLSCLLLMLHLMSPLGSCDCHGRNSSPDRMCVWFGAHYKWQVLLLIPYVYCSDLQLRSYLLTTKIPESWLFIFSNKSSESCSLNF